MITKRADLIQIYKNEEEIDINKNTRINLRFMNQNEDQRSILTFVFYPIGFTSALVPYVKLSGVPLVVDFGVHLYAPRSFNKSFDHLTFVYLASFWVQSRWLRWWSLLGHLYVDAPLCLWMSDVKLDQIYVYKLSPIVSYDGVTSHF